MATMNGRRAIGLSVALATVLGAMSAPARAQKPATAPQATNSFEMTNVCERVPGEEVATAVKGKLLDVRPVNVAGYASARCIYGVDIGEARQTFLIWFNPASDYDDLRKVASGLVKPMADIGDAAHLTTDSDTKRVIITATKRRKVTIQVTGEREEWVSSLATLALSKFP